MIKKVQECTKTPKYVFENQFSSKTQSNDLTSMSPVYSKDSPVHRRVALFLNFQVYSQTDPGF